VSTESEKAASTAAAQSTLQAGIAKFYDESTGLWLSIWGDHCHHGFYPTDGPAPSSNQQAQEDMIDQTLKFADVQAVAKVTWM
jgi:tocopherol O-methyltransferase